MKKLTYEYVKNYFKEQGCELLEKEYIGSHSKMKYRCNCGNISEINFANFKLGKRCKKCSGSEKYTFEYVKQYFKERGCELLEKEYKNNITKMKYKCNCGNISKTVFSRFKRGGRCARCNGTEKLTFKYVKDYFKKRGCELLEKEYKNTSTCMKYKCHCGNISNTTFRNIQQHKKCAKCNGTEKFTFEYVKNYFEERGCELLEKEYKNVNFSMKYRCECGNISRINFSRFKKGERCKKGKGLEKFTFEYVKNYFIEQGCKLLENKYKYKNTNTSILYKCKCGNISRTNFNSFRKSKKCHRCGVKEAGSQRRHSFKYVKNYFEANGCELLEKEYRGTHIPMKYKCICGNISKIRFSNFKQGQRCIKCAAKKRSGKNSYNYNPNLTDQERKNNKSRMSNLYYKRWRKKVFIRDNYTCQRCDRKGYKLHAHHIKNYSSNKKLRFVVSNGITLCKKCHDIFHEIYSKKKNNKKQLKEYLNLLIV